MFWLKLVNSCVECFLSVFLSQAPFSNSVPLCEAQEVVNLWFNKVHGIKKIKRHN
jgi:hypothetical protein